MKTVALQLGALLFSLISLWGFAGGFGTAAEDSEDPLSELILLYSGNARGELEPCG